MLYTYIYLLCKLFIPKVLCVVYNQKPWWLHASENPSSILCVVSGHICTYFYHNPFSGIVYSIMSNKTLPYHTIICLIYYPVVVKKTYFSVSVSVSVSVTTLTLFSPRTLTL